MCLVGYSIQRSPSEALFGRGVTPGAIRWRFVQLEKKETPTSRWIIPCLYSSKKERHDDQRNEIGISIYTLESPGAKPGYFGHIRLRKGVYRVRETRTLRATKSHPWKQGNISQYDFEGRVYICTIFNSCFRKTVPRLLWVVGVVCAVLTCWLLPYCCSAVSCT